MIAEENKKEILMSPINKIIKTNFSQVRKTCFSHPSDLKAQEKA